MKLSPLSISLLEGAIRKAISKYTCGREQTIVTDIHLQPNQHSGELSIFDDDDEELANVIIEEWISNENDNFYQQVAQKMTHLLNNMKNAGELDKLTIMNPYSFVLVDEDKETISELLLIDEDTLLLNEELLKGLDEELDTFLKDLLEN